jgi:mycothiol system anti-sigma-R factor
VEIVVQCAESLRVQAYFDGELDAPSAVEVERHAEHCAECREQLEDLGKIRSAIRETLTHESAPPELRASIASALDQADRRDRASSRAELNATFGRGWLRPSFWLGALSGTVGTAIAAALALMLWLPASQGFLDDLVAAHVRSLMPAHLIDVVSSDRHTVKPWFEGHADVSPTVVDFAGQGYRLVGGRTDYLDHQRVAVVVYQHGAHVINVFVWDARRGSLPKSATRDGYRMLFWKTGDLTYCAVSDTGWDELSALARLMEAQ